MTLKGFKERVEQIEGKQLAPRGPETVQVGKGEVTLTHKLPEYVPDGYAAHDGPVPNIDKLTRKERWIMDRLPGFSESKVGHALATFGESWAGKALMKLDILAEGLERGTGFVTQYADAWANTQNTGDPSYLNEFKENLGAAWYAGGLSADMMNLPDLSYKNYSFAKRE